MFILTHWAYTFRYLCAVRTKLIVNNIYKDRYRCCIIDYSHICDAKITFLISWPRMVYLCVCISCQSHLIHSITSMERAVHLISSSFFIAERNNRNSNKLGEFSLLRAMILSVSLTRKTISSWDSHVVKCLTDSFHRLFVIFMIFISFRFLLMNLSLYFFSKIFNYSDQIIINKWMSSSWDGLVFYL